MAIGIAPYRPASSRMGAASGYARVWRRVAVLAAVGWIVVAVLQTPRLPLLALAIGLGAVGGVLFLHASLRSRTGRRQYVAGAGRVAGVVLATVGIGHHLEAGLVTAVLLAGSAPRILSWVSGK
jgi:hypothetical protein